MVISENKVNTIVAISNYAEYEALYGGKDENEKIEVTMQLQP